MKAGYGRMVMCHMLADTSEELRAMARTIGVAEKWIQHPGTYREHFDICLSKRALAVQHGAKEVSQRSLGMIWRERRLAAKSAALGDEGVGK
jgi:hypothetical protein